MAVCLPDTSCLIHLERIGRLDLLHSLYAEIRVPPAVRDEYGGVPEGMQVVSVSSTALVHLLRRTVDAGSRFWPSDALHERALDRAGERPTET